ncbi:hypothetical protein [Ralstonia insidiosa]|uniref:hypothetical protein n=1 Tax=Ralstonia insidiosa TaxID=190721 RepID=UPI000CEEA096|nr:hypothetical protein [Ralstonia insidiosa]
MSSPIRAEYPALTNAQFVIIGDRYGHDPVVRRLLMEVRALQNLVCRAHQVAESAGPGSRTDAFGIAVEALHRELAAETWFHERMAKRAAYRASLTEAPSPGEGRAKRPDRKR